MKTGIMALDSHLAVTINRLIRTQIDLPLRTPFIHIILITQTGASVKLTPVVLHSHNLRVCSDLPMLKIVSFTHRNW